VWAVANQNAIATNHVLWMLHDGSNIWFVAAMEHCRYFVILAIKEI
jgi:hypothetical protein